MDQGQLAAFVQTSQDPVAVGRELLAYRQGAGMTQKALGRAIDRSSSTIHCYESLATDLDPELAAALTAGRLTVKEARALSDLPRGRQLELGRPFVSGRLSSFYVERFVACAKARPDLDVESLVAELGHSHNTEASTATPRPRPAMDLARVERYLLDTAGLAAALPLEDIPIETRRALRVALNLVKAKSDEALASLDGQRTGIDAFIAANKTEAA
jgi:DNA-binding XRE family transcriptional regulator